jgi:thiol-disulfide isomerase/thioredoxin
MKLKLLPAFLTAFAIGFVAFAGMRPGAAHAAEVTLPPFRGDIGKLKTGDVVDFEVITAEGHTAKLSEFTQGKTAVIGYWTAGEGGPDAMMTRLEELSKKYRDAGVAVLGLGVSDTREAFDAWRARTKGQFTFPVVLEPAGKFTRAAKTREEMTPGELKIETARSREYYAKTISMPLIGAILKTPATIVLDAERKYVGLFVGFGPTAADSLGNLLLRAGVKLAAEDMPAKIYPVEPKAAASAVADAARPELLKVGAVAPDFVTTDVNGRVVKLSDFKDKIVVLDFWATWCGPCLASMPHTQEVAAHFKDQGVVILGSCTSDTRDKFDAWVKINQAKYPDFVFAHDAAERSAERASFKLYGVSAIPYQFIIGRDGRVAATQIGYSKGEVLLEAALAKAGVKVDPAILAKAEIDQQKREATK